MTLTPIRCRQESIIERRTGLYARRLDAREGLLLGPRRSSPVAILARLLLEDVAVASVQNSDERFKEHLGFLLGRLTFGLRCIWLLLVGIACLQKLFGIEIGVGFGPEIDLQDMHCNPP